MAHDKWYVVFMIFASILCIMAVATLALLINLNRLMHEYKAYAKERDKETDTAGERREEKGKQQKDLIARTQEDMQKMIDFLPIPMLMYEPYDKKTIYANNAYIKILEMDSIEALRELDQQTLLPKTQPDGDDSVQAMARFINTAMTTDYAQMMEFQFILPGGRLIDVMMTAANIIYNGKKVLTFVFEDISAAKKQSQMLQNLAYKEKEANLLKSRFIVNMSHEIRTPMNVIIGLSEIELNKAHGRKNYDIYRKINSSARNLLTIVDDILDFSKMEAQKLDIIEGSFEVESLISDALLVVSQRLNDKDVEMIADIDCSLPSELIGDRTRIWQILKNLLDNAAKYTEHGVIIVTARDGGEDGGGRLNICFEVRDTGLGMTKEQLDKLFIPFEQFHLRDVKTSGTGLGMPITKQLIEMMGGTLDIKSRHGAGTAAAVLLPLRQTEDRTTIRERNIKEELSQKRILVVDDNPMVCELMRSLLENLGIMPVCVSNFKEAVLNAVSYEKKGMPFHAAIIDYILSCDQNGVELARRLNTSVKKPPRMILLSAYSRRLMPAEINDAGFVDVIEKPFVPSVLVHKLCEAMDIKSVVVERVKNMQFDNARVLLCEDNLINQEVALGMLSLYNITPTIANNGKEAVELLESEPFDMVLMDIIMPVMDGHDAAKLIRSSTSAYRDIPIVAMTANAMQEEIDKCMQEGMNGHISKPIESGKLLAQLIKWLPKAIHETSVMPVVNLTDEIEEFIDGIDMYDGIMRFSGKKDRYFKALRSYAAQLESVAEMIKAAESVGDTEALGRHIHYIKGVSGNLGVKKIYELTIALENDVNDQSGHDEEHKKEVFKTFYTYADMIIKEIAMQIPEEGLGVSIKEAGERGECAAILMELRDALQRFDPSGCEAALVRLKSKDWKGVDKNTLNDMYVRVESYTFDVALEFLDKILGG